MKNQIFLPYEYVAIVAGLIVLFATVLHLFHIIPLAQIAKDTLIAVLFISMGILMLKTQRILGILIIFWGIMLVWPYLI
ncbi:hypothetical protein [Staphylococcus ratti]|uniref:Uncharacterized protein n=1 Tax=Staphylococcus ratti TaxID=2892440 RepID=A0ABY3PDE0_9STAP|nr:hypothetical protein [Staphylococcus ratti]UEX90312.1 hypothetical protein LN051_01165 [Staphylococcus ratti]